MGKQKHFGWLCDGFEEIDPDDEEDTIREVIGIKKEEYEEVSCPEQGCNNGWITLLFSRAKCSVCKGTGKVKQKKGK